MSRKVALSVLAAVALLTVRCEEVPLTASAGTSIFLQANPTFVISNGGHAVVTALLTEPAGTLVPDGTVVFFFTNLGTIDERVKTVDGLARANFVADSRSGPANIVAYSGGPAPAPTNGTGTGTGTGSASGTGNASITITVGSALPAIVLVTANPARIASSRQSEIIANVYDERGNPIQNVPVIFSITAGSTETLDSGGAPRHTDSNGQAFDILRSRAIAGGAATTAEVTATVPNSKSGKVTVTVAVP